MRWILEKLRWLEHRFVGIPSTVSWHDALRWVFIKKWPAMVIVVEPVGSPLVTSVALDVLSEVSPKGYQLGAKRFIFILPFAHPKEAHELARKIGGMALYPMFTETFVAPPGQYMGAHIAEACALLHERRLRHLGKTTQ